MTQRESRCGRFLVLVELFCEAKSQEDHCHTPCEIDSKICGDRSVEQREAGNKKFQRRRGKKSAKVPVYWLKERIRPSREVAIICKTRIDQQIVRMVAAKCDEALRSAICRKARPRTWYATEEVSREVEHSKMKDTRGHIRAAYIHLDCCSGRFLAKASLRKHRTMSSRQCDGRDSKELLCRLCERSRQGFWHQTQICQPAAETYRVWHAMLCRPES